MKYFTKEWYRQMQKLGRCGSQQEWDRMHRDIEAPADEYGQYLKRVGLTDLDDDLNFHDWRIHTAYYEDTDYCIRFIYDEEDIAEGHYTEIRLKNASILQQDIQPDGKRDIWWLYNEVYATPNGYELHFLLDADQLCEWTISCSDIAFIKKYD